LIEQTRHNYALISEEDKLTTKFKVPLNRELKLIEICEKFDLVNWPQSGLRPRAGI